VATHPRFLGLESTGLFSNFQNGWQDFLFKRSGEAVKPGDPRLILLAVDAESGKKYGFPLPRPVYARMLDKLRSLGARVVIFDVMFFEPREGDAELAAASKRFGRVVHLFAQDLQLTEHGVVTTTNLPVAPLLKSTTYIGHPNIDDLIDDDGHLRRFSLFRAGAPDPLRQDFDAISLEAAALSADQGKTYAQVRDAYGTGIRTLNFRRPATWLAHEKRDTAKKIANPDVVSSPYRRISLLDVLSDDLTAGQREALNGGVVIVGSTALGYYDHYPTPFIDQAPGAEFHLNAIDNVLHGDAMGSSARMVTLLLVVLAVLLTYVLQMVPAAASAAAAGAAVVLWTVYSVVMFRRGFIVEFVPPALAFVASYLVLTVHRVRAEGAEKKAIKSLFGQFVAPEVVAQLADDPSKVKLRGDKVELTIFFLDIAHFTNLSEKMDPHALIQFLNKYLSALSEPILDSHGTIDKFIGDCIMAFWNAPVRDADHRADAVLSALACQDIIKELNKTLDPGIPEVPAVRIGINSGTATVGLTGTQRKLAYTAIGDEVNLASRLEGANKFFGSKIMCSESTWLGCQDKVVARYLGKARVVGKETPIAVYEPLAPKGKLPPEWQKALPLYEQGVKDFDARKYAEALASFKKFAELMPEDGPGQLYLRLSTDYAALPPDETWQGVFNLTAK
ncbi:MAG: adenylate/guanylate cyclase domain-containing protein, partial [Elusimicrobia bacterium]|nr:adenylate/guanylate cyclase domain-containing protein [Elusimicrobiota bacterium]